MSETIWVETFCLNLESASADTYQTWVTVRLLADGTLERKSNLAGNGQAWLAFGEMDGVSVRLANTKEFASKVFAHVVRKQGFEADSGGFGAAWRYATMIHPVVNKATGRVLTAAPSIREGYPPRDKNVRRRRWTASLASMLAEREARRRMVVEPKPL